MDSEDARVAAACARDDRLPPSGTMVKLFAAGSRGEGDAASTEEDAHDVALESVTAGASTDPVRQERWDHLVSLSKDATDERKAAIAEWITAYGEEYIERNEDSSLRIAKSRPFRDDAPLTVRGFYRPIVLTMKRDILLSDNYDSYEWPFVNPETVAFLQKMANDETDEDAKKTKLVDAQNDQKRVETLAQILHLFVYGQIDVPLVDLSPDYSNMVMEAWDYTTQTAKSEDCSEPPLVGFLAYVPPPRIHHASVDTDHPALKRARTDVYVPPPANQMAHFTDFDGNTPAHDGDEEEEEEENQDE